MPTPRRASAPRRTSAAAKKAAAPPPPSSVSEGLTATETERVIVIEEGDTAPVTDVLGESAPPAAVPDAVLQQAQREAEARREAAQSLTDQGWSIVLAGQDPDGSYWYDVEKSDGRGDTARQRVKVKI